MRQGGVFMVYQPTITILYNCLFQRTISHIVCVYYASVATYYFT